MNSSCIFIWVVCAVDFDGFLDGLMREKIMKVEGEREIKAPVST
jgi:hypothetical protein